MSYTELHTGILHKLPIEGEENIKEFFKQKLIEKNPNKQKEYSQLDDLDYIFDELYYADIVDNYYCNRKQFKLYEIINHKNYDDAKYIDEWEMQPNGDIKFITQFYNGGCCLDEAIEYALENLDKNETNKS